MGRIRIGIPFNFRTKPITFALVALLAALLPGQATAQEALGQRPPIKQAAATPSPSSGLPSKAPAAKRPQPASSNKATKATKPFRASAAGLNDPCAVKTTQPTDVLVADDSYLQGPEQSRIELLRALLVDYATNSEGCHDAGQHQDSQFIIFVSAEKSVIDRKTRLWFADRRILSPESTNDLESVLKHYPSQDSISLNDIYKKKAAEPETKERLSADERLKFLEDTLQQVQLVYVPRFEKDGDCYRTYSVVMVPSKSFDGPVNVATSDSSKLPLTPSLLGERNALEQVVSSQSWIKRLSLEREGECTPDTNRQTGVLYKADAIQAALTPLTKALGRDFVEASTSFWNKVRAVGDPE